MDLQKYIAEALGQILAGVRDAQAKELGDNINAATFSLPPDMKAFNSNIGTFTLVEFDVAVSAETSGGGGANLKVFGIGAEGAAEHRQGHANRIQFAVPVRLPDGDQSKMENWRSRNT